MRSLPDRCTELARAVMDRDPQRSEHAFRDVVAEVEQATVADLSEAAVRLIPALETVALGNGGVLAQLTAGLIEHGADPLPVLGVLVARVADGLERAARFPDLAAHIAGEVTMPAGPEEFEALIERVVRAAPAAGLSSEEAQGITQSWLTVNDWIPSLLLPLQQKRARLALPYRDRITAAAQATAEEVDDARWLLGLLLVLDDEPLLVLHRPTGQGYTVTISGIGDNFQLHTLLAGTLIGDPARGLIVGERPDPAWIAAAFDGPMQPLGGLRGQFNLVDANGDWIWNEGRPSDIPVFDATRVVVLDPPPYERSWNIGRAYPLMVPELTLNRVLTPTEATGWLDRAAPAATPHRPDTRN